MSVDVRRVFAVFLPVCLGLAFATPALAKGGGPPRGYAVVTGPGLAHPIIVSAPWNPRLGGYYSGEAEVLINVATFAGAIPGWVHYSPRHPSARVLGPPYEVRYFMDRRPAVADQFLYPYSTSGGLWVHTPPGQRAVFKAVFGRYWAGGPREEWASGPQGDTSLLYLLQLQGLPAAAPSAPKPASTAAATPTATFPWLVLALGIPGLVILGLIMLWSHLRRRKASALLKRH